MMTTYDELSVGDEATPLVVEKPQDPHWDPSKRPDPPAKGKRKNA